MDGRAAQMPPQHPGLSLIELDRLADEEIATTLGKRATIDFLVIPRRKAQNPRAIRLD